MDCAAQSMDPCFALAIHGLHTTCAIHGLRNHRDTPRVKRLWQKKKGSKSRERKGNRGFTLPFGWRSSLQDQGEVGFSLLDAGLPSSWTEERVVFTSQENVMELRLYTIDVFRSL